MRQKNMKRHWIECHRNMNIYRACIVFSAVIWTLGIHRKAEHSQTHVQPSSHNK